MVCAESEEIYLGLYAELIDLDLPQVSSYFNDNWHEIRREWVACFTMLYHNFCNRTTNRVELLNAKLKSVVTKYTTLQKFFFETLECIKSAVIESDHRTISKVQRKPIIANDEPQGVFDYRLY